MSDSEKVTFDVRADDPATELFLIDGNFELVDRGLGSRSFTVAPGIYKIKARIGRTTDERIIVVRKDMPPIDFGSVHFISSAPLTETVKTHEWHQLAAEQATAPAIDEPDDASAVVIVVREWTKERPDPIDAPRPNPARGLKLRRLDGTEVADIETETKPNDLPDPCVAFRKVVEPGAYRLGVEDGRRKIELPVIVCKGWQTEVYLLTGSDGNAALSGAAITMREHGTAFHANDVTFRLEEMARAALIDDRKILSDEMRKRFSAPDASPMLALFGAQLLIREAKNAKAKKEDVNPEGELIDNREPVREIVQNLRARIGKHPDVEAIAIGAGVRDPEYRFEAPPMLRSSWRLLLKASADNVSLIPADSFLAQVAERPWGEGSWNLWVEDNLDRTSIWQTQAEELLSFVQQRRVRTSGGTERVPSGVLASLEAAPAPLPAAGTPIARGPAPRCGGR